MELYKKFIHFRSNNENQDNNNIFGENPFEIYEKYCKWFEEEMPKTEKQTKEAFSDLKLFNLCMNIFLKINETADLITNLPYMKLKRYHLSTFAVSKKRKRIKKPKYFVCEICQEEFNTGCSLGISIFKFRWTYEPNSSSEKQELYQKEDNSQKTGKTPSCTF